MREHQEARLLVTDEVVQLLMDPHREEGIPPVAEEMEGMVGAVLVEEGEVQRVMERMDRMDRKQIKRFL